jgi:protein ImuB
MARYIAIWFRHLLTDWYVRKHPDMQAIPLVFATNQHGRQVITAASVLAEQQGIYTGMPVADAKAIFTDLRVIAHIPGQEKTLLLALGEWCIRYAPIVAIDLPNGLIIDASGCAHLWGGEQTYLKEIILKLRAYGYDVRGAMANTIGTAWAISRYGKVKAIINSGEERISLLQLPPAALRLEPALLPKLQQLGFYHIDSFISMPLGALKRRFGQHFITRLQQALGREREDLQPIGLTPVYEERLSSLDPIRTPKAIAIAIERLLTAICTQLQQDEKGLRAATLICYRVDDQVAQLGIGTNRASAHAVHLMKLFELKLPGLAPGPGIDLFILQATAVEDLVPPQEKLWATTGTENNSVALLLDRIAGKIGKDSIHRFQPAPHYWPERAMQPATTQPVEQVRAPRPEKLLPKPLPIEVTAPIPDYPPMLFRFRHQLHEIRKADGPERIEREWWLDEGEHRDYYTVEDALGRRYWIFRLGHYAIDQSQWYIHGFFA